MYPSWFVSEVEQNIFILKKQYDKYAECITTLFHGKLPLPIINRQKELQLLFETLAYLLPVRGVVYSQEKYSVGQRSMGIWIYNDLQKQITAMNCIQNAWSYEVQKTLTDIRVCFYYLLQEVEEYAVGCEGRYI